MSDYSLWKREDEIEQERKGLTGRGIFGCVTFLVSGGLAYLGYTWLSQEYNLRRLLSIPKDWPGWLIDALGILVLLIAVQAVLTIIGSVFWKLSGRDKKVAGKLDDMLKQWDEKEF
jgi:hypothetical protein